MKTTVRITVVLAIVTSVWTCDRAEGYTAEGVIRGPDGRPVPGAEVRLYVPDYDVPPGQAGAPLFERQTTGEDGQYEFTVATQQAENPRALIIVRKEGLAWNCRRWPLLADAETDIRLAQPQALGGTVLDDQGRPVAGARITLHQPRSGAVRAFYLPEPIATELLATETDHQGRFRFMILSADWQTEFLIEADGYATVRTGYLPDALYRIYTPGQTDLRLSLEPEARVQGTVVRESDGRPIGGVEVRIGRTETGVAYGFDSAISDRDGRFSFERIPEGAFWVGTATSHVPDAEWVGWPVRVRTKAGETTDNIRLELTHGGFFESVVCSQQGDVVEGAAMTVFDEPGSRLAQGRTDAKGLCRIRLPAGSYKLVDVSKWGYHTYDPHTFFDVEKGETTRREVALKKADRIEGTVIDGEGEPASHVHMTLMPSPTGTVLTDNRGRFAMFWDKGFAEYSAAPRFELIALDREHGRAGIRAMREGMGSIRLTLRPAVRVTGTVVDSDGEPVEAALVDPMLKGDLWGMNLAPYKRLLTDRSGRFTIGSVPPGRTCEIGIRARGGRAVKREFTMPTEAIRPVDLGTITLTPGSDCDG